MNLPQSVARSACIILLISAPLKAAEPPAITDSNYNLDVFQGPVTTASRVIGLAGAYSALAEWCEGEYSNAASPAVRAPYSLGKWDYDICLGYTNPGAFAGKDFENRGRGYATLPTRFDNSVTLNLGFQLQYRALGVTVNYDQIRFGIKGTTPLLNDGATFLLNRFTTSAATALLDDQLVVGVGFRAMVFALNQKNHAERGSTLLSDAGTGTQVGAILKPRRLPFRLGATFRSVVSVPGLSEASRNVSGTSTIDGKILPTRMQVPWEFEFGGAVELGRRPFNPQRIDLTYSEDAIRTAYGQKRLERALEYERQIALAPRAHRDALRRQLELQEVHTEAAEDRAMELALSRLTLAQKARARLWDRQQVVLSSSVLVTGASENAVGVSDFLAQRRVASGESIAVSLRLGLETEAIPTWLMVRGGTYLEPSRYADSQPRVHLTAGADIRLFRFSPFGIFGEEPWRLRLATDVAVRYSNWAIAIGKYH